MIRLRPVRVRSMLQGLWKSPLTWLALSVFLAGSLLAEVNLMSARAFRRFDFTAEARHSLSPETRSLLRQERPFEILVLLPPEASGYADIRLLLDTFRSESRAVSVRYLDPTRDVALYLKEVGTDRPDNASENIALVVRRGEQRSVVSAQELIVPGVELNRRIEQALRRAIEEISTSEQGALCFVTGHGEPTLGELGRTERRLASLGSKATSVSFGQGDVTGQLSGCAVVAVVQPGSPWPRAHVDLLRGHMSRGGRLLLAVSPSVTQGGDLETLGLDPLFHELGVRFRSGFVLERDSARRLPEGLGEVFFPEPVPHAITLGLAPSSSAEGAKPVAVAAGAFEIIDRGQAAPFLQSSSRSVLIRSLGEPSEGATEGPFDLGVAFLGLAARARDPQATPARAVLLSFSNLFEPTTPSTVTTHGNDWLIENSLLWLKGRATLPPSSDANESDSAVSLTLSEESLTSLGRYVLLEIPAFTLIVGIALLWLRRRGSSPRTLPRGESS